MPTPVLKSLAKKAGKSLSTAEKYWKEAKSDAKKQGKEGNYAYITGIVKKRLGVESIDLLSCGAPIDCVVESELNERVTPGYYIFNRDRMTIWGPYPSISKLPSFGGIKIRITEGDCYYRLDKEGFGRTELPLGLSVEGPSLKDSTQYEKVLSTLVLVEILRVEVDKKKSNVVFIGEDGAAAVRRSFMLDFNKWVEETRSLEDLRKIFPNSPEQYLQFLVECFTPEMLKKLFPNSEQNYVKFMSEQ